MDQSARAVRDTARTKSAAGIPQNAGLLARLCCPRCHSKNALLLNAHAGLSCADCTADFPVFNDGVTRIPWLFPTPDSAHLEWSARYRGFLKNNADKHNRLNRALADARDSSATRKRIYNTLRAHREHRNQIMSLLAPMGLDADDLVPAVTRVLQEGLPKNQGLTSYANNVFRDWAWNNGENEAIFEAVEEVLRADEREGIGSVLTLGAGACRIPYDLHTNCAPSLSVALDFNPLLLLVASRIIGGSTLPLYEFPVAPVDDAAAGVLQHCRAPDALNADPDNKIEFVFGDATNPPFARHSFDTIVTPWLIDILRQDLRDFIPTVNRLLPIDGLWVNTGPLAFIDDDPCRCYGEVEVVELVQQNGFEILTIDHRPVPYLQSPHSAHGRVEKIVSFAAKKRIDIEPVTSAPTLPEWILDTTRSVPSSTEMTLTSSSYLLTAQVLAAVDGKRSIDAIAKLVARQYDLSIEECIHATQRILAEAGRTPLSQI